MSSTSRAILEEINNAVSDDDSGLSDGGHQSQYSEYQALPKEVGYTIVGSLTQLDQPWSAVNIKLTVNL
jgi:hypothetical protein